MHLTEELNNLMAKYHFRPERKFNQYFLVDEEILDKILQELELKKEDCVVEIDAKTGFLAKKLQEKSFLSIIEQDEKLSEMLEKELDKKTEIIKDKLLNAGFEKYNKVVSILPNSSNKELMKILFKEKLNLAVIVFQKAFAEKLLAFPGYKEYSAMTVLTNYFTELNEIAKIEPYSFFPNPNTISIIIKFKFEKKHGTTENEKKFIHFVEEVFRHKNKKIRNSLTQSFSLNKKDQEKIDNILSKTEVEEKKVMQLETKEFVELFNKLEKYLD